MGVGEDVVAGAESEAVGRGVGTERGAGLNGAHGRGSVNQQYFSIHRKLGGDKHYTK